MDNIDPKRLEGYEKSLKIMKNNVNRIVAVTLFLLSGIVFLGLLGFLIDSIFINILKYSSISVSTVNKLNITLKILLVVCPLIFIFLPLHLGIKKWFYDISSSNKQTVQLSVIFFYFKHIKIYYKALTLQLDLLLKKLIILGICLIPYTLFKLWCVDLHIELNVLGLDILKIISVVLLICGIIFAFIYNLRYFMVQYLFFNNSYLMNSELFFKSDCIMRIRKKEVIEMYISFAPFYILSLLIIPILFLFPYMVLYFIQMSKEFMGKSMNCK